MILLLIILAAVAGVLILPGWYWSKKNRPQPAIICLLPVAGLMLWLLLISLGFGAQSLANVMEAPVIAAVAVMAAYAKFFIFDRVSALSPYGKIFVIVVVLISTVALRAFMPVIPE